MRKRTVDCFLLHECWADTLKTVESLNNQPEVNDIYLLAVTADAARYDELPENCHILSVDGIGATSTYVKMADNAASPYTLLYIKSSPLQVGARALHRLCEVMDDSKAVMVYSDHWSVEKGETKPHPSIDCQEGSLRDDFDFGSLMLLSTATLKAYAASEPCGHSYSGFYDLRLFCQRCGLLFHLDEMLYTEEESDLRLSGEKQFDYVDPSKRAVQIEMEQVCTEHLKAIGAYLAPSEFEDVRFDKVAFRYEASVIIPVRNREKTVADAIGSALAQQASFEFNVIVVDNHSTDGTYEAIERFKDNGKVVHLVPERTDLGIGGCWDYAVCSPYCGKFAVQLDSDDLYSAPDTLQRIVDAFYEQRAAMVVGTYTLVDFKLNTLPPGKIDHKEWTEANGRNNALRINGLGAPRAFYTPLLREIGFPNTSYGEDYAVGLAVSRHYRIGRIYDVLYLCRRWEGNSDAALSIEKTNKNNLYKDRIRTLEVMARKQMNKRWNHEVKEEEAHDFFEQQLRSWPDAERRFQDLENVEVKNFSWHHIKLSAQFNPARIVSTGAKVDKEAINHRPCFLCEHNQPAEQMHLYAYGNYQLCINPFPILPYHFTFPARRHVKQMARPMVGALCRLAMNMPDFVVFYNGAQCGASAPDHAHLQLGAKGKIPLQRDWEAYESQLEPVYTLGNDRGIYLLRKFVYPLFVLKLSGDEEQFLLFERLLKALPLVDGEDEPRFNLLGWRQKSSDAGKDSMLLLLIPRKKLRPECYFKEGEEQYLISPGSIDMGGLVITPRREDFDRLTGEKIASILQEVTLGKAEVEVCVDRIRNDQNVSVGIMNADSLHFTLNGSFVAGGITVSGLQEVDCNGDVACWNGKAYSTLCFRPVSDASTFTLHGVTIGKDYHWERKEDQEFKGSLEIIIEKGKLTAVNILPVEEYLVSVISSEMKATAGLEFLKAAAIISRSWLLSQIRRRESEITVEASQGMQDNEHCLLRWTDRAAHKYYDVCADDHCQRYQGLLRVSNPTAREAVEATQGQVLMADGEICDTRFSKCCGGVSEEYAACWEQREVAYLQPVRDLHDDAKLPDLTREDEAEAWICSDAPAFCNTTDRDILQQVLNDYDLETTDFYRWQVEYTQRELSDLINLKTGRDFGDILDLQPVKRGKSGRIVELRIVGSKRSLIVGKELEIRSVLSPSHLYSSAFVVKKEDVVNGIPGSFRLIGAGWGHGVGLCQIGAAVMASQGYAAGDILQHYYKHTTVKQLYTK